jgi:hypothetical protein
MRGISLTSTNTPASGEAKVIGFPVPKEAWSKPLTLEDWPWDQDLGKPYGDINGPPEYPAGVLTLAQEGETNDLARYKEPIDRLLVEREKTHGPYKVKAKIIQDLKCAMELTEGWDNLNDMQRESLHMIAHKIGRILSGDPNVEDHWLDCSGYAMLVVHGLRDANKAR